MKAKRDFDAEILVAMGQVLRGEGTIVLQGTDCPHPVGTRLSIPDSCSEAVGEFAQDLIAGINAHPSGVGYYQVLSADGLPLTGSELIDHIMDDEVMRMYPHVVQPLKALTRIETDGDLGVGHVSN